MSRIRGTVPVGQIIKGNVTKVNTFMPYFEVDKTFRVYIDLTNTSTFLPCLNDAIKITNPIKFSTSTYTAVLGPDTICKFPGNSSNCDTNPLLELIKLDSIFSDADEVIAIDLIVRKLEPFVTVDAVPLCIKTLYQYRPSLGGLDHSKKSFRKVQAKTPKDLFYANTNSELYTFLNFDGECMYGVYPNRRIQKVTDCISEFLIGILAVQDIHGYFTLQDNTSEILVKFNSTSKDLHKFHNCLVLITKYTVFAEIYRDRTQPTLHYVLLDAPDVIIVRSNIEKERKKIFYGTKESLCVNKKYTYFLQTCKISEVIYGYNKGPECWVEALISPDEKFSQSELVYAIIPKELLEIVPFLKEYVIYKVHTDQKLKYGDITIFRELYGMKEIRKVILLSPDSLFQETIIQTTGTDDKVLEDFHEIKSHIASTRNFKMFSFVLKIEKKVLQDKTYTSWFPKRHANVQQFGDTERHQQRLIFREKETKSYIDLYLTNRENHVIPLGLVSGIMVKVKHVQVNKGKYLKATVFTGFEIVDYCPDFSFSSVNLSFTDRGIWQWRTKTTPTLLGMYTHVPPNCIVHGTVLFLAILDLELSVVCTKCRRSKLQDRCGVCEAKDMEIVMSMVIHIQDPINSMFTIEVDSIYFLLDLLGLRNERGIAAFNEECLRGGMQYHGEPLNIDFLKIPEDYVIKSSSLRPGIQKIISIIRSQINYKYFFMMDVVCIRQLIEGRKPWRLIEYEFVS